ncbi:polyprenyl synthetase family protein [Flectobacillus roseus]|jgi:geranylgeranyl diphosphate synthase type II|uniref:polyprenyl synthetase family protein n=1 Tax=Flectobacillus roseus TaxID=502259 RepID=UPI001412CAC4|nr:polyprenyl synthetase family protein [Flectobacillus roseus]MDI9869853.1 polyprenyl synthetase family protein [Flectobacillus roseus]NBA74826.1 polyprenyl synthetase family protein [Emticicia sp. ODNR4P]
MTTKQFIQALEEEFQQQQYGQSPVELYEPIRYLMSLGGKRLRPLMTLMSTALFTDEWQKAIKPATAVEVFHNFTLMHDDIMDNAPLRRGKPTVHAKWNDNTAILSGDVMLVQAYELMLFVEDTHLKKALRRFNRTAAEVCEGQQFDMNFETRENVTEEEYIEMIRLKTSVLLGFALELGGIIGGASDKTCQTLYDLGINIGLGFQLKDDVLDVYGDPIKFGKQVGGDIISNKKTYMLIEALSSATGETKTQLEHWISLKTFDPAEKVNAVRGIYDQLGIRQLAEAKINEYFEKAFDLLDSLKVEAERKAELRAFANILIDREV